MTLLKDLLALRQEETATETTAPIVQEAKGASMDVLLDRWMDAERAYSWEGQRGIGNLTKLVKVFGYDSLSGFMEDNSGCLEAMLEWIKSARVPEWKEKLEDMVGESDDNDEDDEDK